MVVTQVGALGIALRGVGLVNHNLTDLGCRQGAQQEHGANEAVVANSMNGSLAGHERSAPTVQTSAHRKAALTRKVRQ